MTGSSNLVIGCAFVLSLALHVTLARPLVMPAEDTPPIDEAPTLVIELQGVTADEQIEERVAQQVPEPEQREQEQPQQPVAAPAQPDEAGEKPPEPQPQISTQVELQPSLASPPRKDEPAQQQEARTIKERDLEASRLREYVRRLGKKARASQAPG